jgi:hypothetical protein
VEIASGRREQPQALRDPQCGCRLMTESGSTATRSGSQQGAPAPYSRRRTVTRHGDAGGGSPDPTRGI